jgi:hypothetical protein
MRKHHALARRLRDRQADYLRFTTDPANSWRSWWGVCRNGERCS